ncbi:MAG: tRNA uridine-5-carboxymethylaminomethyl(34) synthesis GTPase MnmE [Clostridiales Family XIII bacterium]|jgi:tRNA modification GTPase|nr:tRNA uridine-5-carboxymethylaminomethyl(34) synthesis GTPase MnmE [Clostridiales Family XIII bacterium]
MIGTTIAAISSAIGEGGIGVVRMSGEDSKEILAKIFEPADKGWIAGHTPLGHLARNDNDLEPRKMKYGHIVSSSPAETVDEVLIVYMKKPHSYTGEDVVEIQCHGSVVSLRKILSLCYENGAVPAAPGEFTKRAFLNGRLDLVQAGAVSDMIRAKTDRSYAVAKDQFEGRLSTAVSSIREDLLGILAESIARIDYPEAFTGEEQDSANNRKFLDELLLVSSRIEGLFASARTGRMVRDGLRIALIGKPNSGKSSFINAISGEQAAIVTAEPGTTRDAIEVYLSVDGLPVIMTDTAGIREAEGEIERIGIDRSLSSYGKADMAFFIIDGSVPLSLEDRNIAGLLDEGKPLVVLVNKSDLAQKVSDEEVAALLSGYSPPMEGLTVWAQHEVPRSGRGGLIGGNSKILHISAMSGEGLGAVTSIISDFIYGGKVSSDDSIIVTNERHKYLLEAALSEVSMAAAVLSSGDAAEFAEVNIREAYDRLGEIVGETVTDDILDRVFADFCIGK